MFLTLLPLAAAFAACAQLFRGISSSLWLSNTDDDKDAVSPDFLESFLNTGNFGFHLDFDFSIVDDDDIIELAVDSTGIAALRRLGETFDSIASFMLRWESLNRVSLNLCVGTGGVRLYEIAFSGDALVRGVSNPLEYEERCVEKGDPVIGPDRSEVPVLPCEVVDSILLSSFCGTS